MPTVAHLVQQYVRRLPHLEQFIQRDLVSFHRLARDLRPALESELGEEVEEGAIVMALSRLRDRLGERRAAQQADPAWGQIQLSLREGVVEIDLAKTPQTLAAAHRLQALMDGGPEDFFSLVSGQYELTLIASRAYEKPFLDALADERILHVERDLSLLDLRFPTDILYQPGFFERVLSELAWEGINVFEIVSTLNELILVLKSKDAARAYELLRSRLRPAPAPRLDPPTSLPPSPPAQRSRSASSPTAHPSPSVSRPLAPAARPPASARPASARAPSPAAPRSKPPSPKVASPAPRARPRPRG